MILLYKSERFVPALHTDKTHIRWYQISASIRGAELLILGSWHKLKVGMFYMQSVMVELFFLTV